ncbi:MAG: zf-TFIIB domain-containing protein [Gaiellales bacterium]
MTSSDHISRSCPVCNEPLQPLDHEGVALDRCGAGHGIWLDRGELRAVVLAEGIARGESEEQATLQAARSDAGHAVVAETGRASRPCPVCSAPMRLTEYAASGIAIDECGEHGTWLDPSELEQIEAYAEGIRRQTKLGAAGGATNVHGAGVRGIDIPADLLSSLRRAAVPPPT